VLTKSETKSEFLKLMVASSTNAESVKTTKMCLTVPNAFDCLRQEENTLQKTENKRLINFLTNIGPYSVPSEYCEQCVLISLSTKYYE
jgi:hypothetical protein